MHSSDVIEAYRAIAKCLGIHIYDYRYKGFRDLIYADFKLVHAFRDGEVCLIEPQFNDYSAIPMSWTQDRPPLDCRPFKKYKFM